MPESMLIQGKYLYNSFEEMSIVDCIAIRMIKIPAVLNKCKKLIEPIY